MIILAKIIFGYKCSPAFGHIETTEGHSFEIFENGEIILKKFVMSGRVIEIEKIIIPLLIVEDVKKILIKQKILIDKLPEEINNNSLDGGFDYFNFLGKKISFLNITRTSEDDCKKMELRWGKLSSYMNEVIQQQNFVLEIFESVYEILKNYGLKVYSWKSFSCDWETE